MPAFAPGPWGACGGLCLSFTGTQFLALGTVDLADASRTDRGNVGEGDGLPVQMDVPGARAHLSGPVLLSAARQELWTVSAPGSWRRRRRPRAEPTVAPVSLWDSGADGHHGRTPPILTDSGPLGHQHCGTHTWRLFKFISSRCSKQR